MKIVVYGKFYVGKSSLLYRFLNYNVPPEVHDNKIEYKYKTNLKIDGIDYELEILDTAGEEDYQNMINTWASFAEGFLLIFAIDDKESFTILKKRYEQILKNKNGIKCPILLVGNKKDLVYGRKVTYDEAKNQADLMGIEYLETSAKTNFNCKQAFEKLAEKIVKSRLSKNKKKGGGRPCIIV